MADGASVTLSGPEHLVAHIVGLEATLTKRNKRIAELEAIIADANYVNDPRLRRAYKEGWKDCAGLIMESTAQAARELGKVRKDAFEIYLQGDRIGGEGDGGAVQLPADQEAVGGAGEGAGAEGDEALGEGHRG
jgi:hypothetical protein